MSIMFVGMDLSMLFAVTIIDIELKFHQIAHNSSATDHLLFHPSFSPPPPGILDLSSHKHISHWPAWLRVLH